MGGGGGIKDTPPPVSRESGYEGCVLCNVCVSERMLGIGKCSMMGECGKQGQIKKTRLKVGIQGI